ncbi:thioredoxin domain-containing protein [Pantoea ananatis]|uniref:DsbA family protein n=1 Tax=Pantoea ananas TaxID=553 RepID=UPI0004963147|nr:thioredoxin domain-containing protein [Pantoea ananatis]
MKKHVKLAAAMLATGFTCAVPAAPADLTPVQQHASAADDFTPAQQARIGEIAADYLVAHPDVLIEVSKKLQARQNEMKQKAYADAAVKAHRLLMQLDGVPVAGPAGAKVIVTEFFDYECIACSMMSPVMEKVMATNPDVRFAFRDWTIFAPRFPESTQASRRGLGIYRQKGAEAYITYHNSIYRTGHNEEKLTPEDIETNAKSAGAGPVNTEGYARSDSLIANNDSLAEMLGLTGTPGIIVMPVENATVENTTVIPGVVSEAVMQQAINKAEGK